MLRNDWKSLLEARNSLRQLTSLAPDFSEAEGMAI